MQRWIFGLLILVLLPACAMKQQLHAFPREATPLMKAETCDCERVEFVEDGGGITLGKGAPRQRSAGRVQMEDGARRDYELVKGALYVTEETGLLDAAAVEVEVGGGILTMGGPSQRRFSRVRQRVDLLNPFDGKRYVLTAVFDGRDARVDIRPRGGSGDRSLGHVAAADGGRINGQDYTLTLLREWGSVSEKRTVKGQTVWHQYPPGAYLVLANGKGHQIKLFQGARTGKVLGMDAFVADRSVAYLPRGMGMDERRDFFLFYYASEFRGELLDDIDMLPDCLGVAVQERMVECPASIVME